MTEEPDIVGAFRKATEWECARFLAPLSSPVSEAEQKLGIRFPAGYLDLVAELKDQGVRMQDIAEVISQPITLNWPKSLVPFFADGGGNYYCFDSANTGPDGEPIIAFWDHEMSREENILYPSRYIGTFASWARRYATEEAPTRPPRRPGKVLGVVCVVVLGLIVFLSVVGAVTVVRWFWQWER